MLIIKQMSFLMKDSARTKKDFNRFNKLMNKKGGWWNV